MPLILIQMSVQKHNLWMHAVFLQAVHAVFIPRFLVRVERYLVFVSFYCYYMMASVIRQKPESQNGGNKKAKHVKFSEKRTSLTPWYLHVRILGKECWLFRRFGVLSFLVTVVLRFTLLPYHRRWCNFFLCY